MQTNEAKKIGGSSAFAIIDEMIALLALGFQAFLVFGGLLNDFKFIRVTNWALFLIFMLLMTVPIWLYVVRLIVKLITRRRFTGTGTGILIITLIMIIPTLFIGIILPVESHTTDIKNYGCYDSCVDDDGLFPDAPHPAEDMREGSDSTYYYNVTYTMDPAYDIYAEWVLKDDSFNKEVARMKALFKSYVESEEEAEWYDFATVEKGGFTCLVKYEKGTPLLEKLEDDSHSYKYTIFAYNRESGQVRYIVTYCMDIVDEEPYYLKLNW